MSTFYHSLFGTLALFLNIVFWLSHLILFPFFWRLTLYFTFQSIRSKTINHPPSIEIYKDVRVFWGVHWIFLWSLHYNLGRNNRFINATDHFDWHLQHIQNKLCGLIVLHRDAHRFYFSQEGSRDEKERNALHNCIFYFGRSSHSPASSANPFLLLENPIPLKGLFIKYIIKSLQKIEIPFFQEEMYKRLKKRKEKAQ